jgi:hypothetical protein
MNSTRQNGDVPVGGLGEPIYFDDNATTPHAPKSWRPAAVLRGAIFGNSSKGIGAWNAPFVDGTHDATFRD